MTVAAVCVLVVHALALPIRLEARGACPTAREVETQLAALIPPGDDGQVASVAQIEQTAGELRITLRRGDGGGGAVRTLAFELPCTAMAKAAALAIAAWHTDVFPRFQVSLPELVARPVALPAPEAKSKSRAAFDLALGFLGSWSGTWAPGLVARAGLGPRGRGWEAGLFAVWESSRRAAVGPGQAHWSRATFGAGGGYRWGQGPLRLSARIDLGLARIALAGTGFDENYRRTAMSPALVMGLRLLAPVAGGPLASWVAVAVAAWPLRQAAVEAPSGVERPLPAVALLLTAGIGLGRFR